MPEGRTVSGEPREVTVLLVDDHRTIVEAVAAALRSEGLTAVVAPSVERTAVLTTADAVAPAVALIDLHLGEGLDGADLIEPLRDRGTEVIVLSGLPAADRRGRCLRLGAAAVLDKAIAFDELVHAIRAVVAGEAVMRTSERDELLRAADETDAAARRREHRFGALTARERAVLAHLAAGRSASDIADLDGVKVSTVRSQIQSVLAKLRVPSQQAAIAVAHTEGFTG